jgi:hypothetical protein
MAGDESPTANSTIADNFTRAQRCMTQHPLVRFERAMK